MPIDVPAAAATAAFAIVHSALASSRAKMLAGRWWGDAFRIAWYRPLFILIAAVATAALAVAVFGHPSPVRWRVDGVEALGMRLLQLICLLAAVDCARRIGFGHVTGVAAAARWVRGDGAHDEPEAQGPRILGDTMRGTGLFRWSRHPLNVLPVLILWLEPTMTDAKISAFSVATLYFILGSYHEERRLLARYGTVYADYCRSGPGFFIPWRSAPRTVPAP